MSFRGEDALRKYLAQLLLDSLDDGNLKNVEYLLVVKNADPNVYLEELDLCPIHCAVGIGTEEFAYNATYLCLKYGGNPNIRNKEGNTPLHIAACWGRRKVADILLKFGGDPFIKDFEGNTALDLALECKQEHLYSRFIVHKWTPTKKRPVEIVERKKSDRNPFLRENNKLSNEELRDNIRKMVGTNDVIEHPQFTDIDSELNYVEIFVPGSSKNSITRSFLTSFSNLSNSCTDVASDTLLYPSDDVGNNISSLTRSSSYQSLISRKTKGNIDSEPNYVEIFVPGSKNSITRSLPSFSDLSNSRIDYASDTLLHRREKNDDNGNNISSLTRSSSYESLISMKTESSAKSWATEYIRNELKRLNVFYGPVVKTTKRLYVRQIKNIINNPEMAVNFVRTNEDGLNEILASTLDSRLPELISKWSPLLDEMAKFFLDQPGRGSRERCYFTYILLDPLITRNLPARMHEISHWERWKIFVKAIFYVGKGKNSRPMAHLHDAVKATSPVQMSDKIARIRSIWSDGSGIICVQAFHNLTEAEAFSREAAMIDALYGCKALTNRQAGDYSGKIKYWDMKNKRRLGVVLLHRAMQIYLAESERQIFQEDL